MVETNQKRLDKFLVYQVENQEMSVVGLIVKPAKTS